MKPDLPQELRQIADYQSGVVTRTQTLAAGISDRVVGALVRRGRWQRLYPGVYAAFSGQLSREAVLWAAVLRAGPGAALSHKTAAELWGLGTDISAPIHLTIPVGRRIGKTPGLAVHLSLAVAVHPAQTPPRTR